MLSSHGFEYTHMQVYFIRHGQTNYNLLHLCNDVVNKQVLLTEQGKLQAATLAQQLNPIYFDKIIVSELPRTRQTADIINQSRQVPVITHPLINDIRSGFDSQPVALYQQAIAQDRMHACINGGESLLQHKQRVMRFIHWLKLQPDNCILVIAHEETLRVFKAVFELLNDAQMIDLKFDNCAVLHYSL
jgi:alpha-ribazole phosphatase